MVYNFFNNKSRVSPYTGTIIYKIVSNTAPENKKSINELHKPIARKIKKNKVYSTYQHNIWVS